MEFDPTDDGDMSLGRPDRIAERRDERQFRQKQRKGQ
jgi:hypothetical protein